MTRGGSKIFSKTSVTLTRMEGWGSKPRVLLRDASRKPTCWEIQLWSYFGKQRPRRNQKLRGGLVVCIPRRTFKADVPGSDPSKGLPFFIGDLSFQLRHVFDQSIHTSPRTSVQTMSSSWFISTCKIFMSIKSIWKNISIKSIFRRKSAVTCRPSWFFLLWPRFELG